MSTAAKPSGAPKLDAEKDLVIYSHSPLFYWWPVWAVGFILALMTLIDGGRMAIVPHDTEARRNWRIEISRDNFETREGLILPKDKHLYPDKSVKPEEALPDPEKPQVHMAHSKNLGVWFAFVLLLIIIVSSVPLRGLWSIVIIVSLILIVTIFALLDWWDPILSAITLLRIHINLGGYVSISLALFIIWAVTFFFFDRQTYLIFSAGQVRVYQQIGEGEKVFDTTNMTFEKKQNDFFRHWIVGLGSGDLKVKTGGPHPEEFDLHNVLFVGNRVKQIEQRLKSREVV